MTHDPGHHWKPEVEEQAAIWRVLGTLVQDGAHYAKTIAKHTRQLVDHGRQLADLARRVARLERSNPTQDRDD